MKAYVLPSASPYVAVTAEDGSFTLANLPAGGELEFQVWHEKSGYVIPPDSGWKRGRFELKITAGANKLGTIKLDPKEFEK